MMATTANTLTMNPMESRLVCRGIFKASGMPQLPIAPGFSQGYPPSSHLSSRCPPAIQCPIPTPWRMMMMMAILMMMIMMMILSDDDG